MLHLLRKPAAPDVELVAPAMISTREAREQVLITQQEVLFKTAAALSVPPAMMHRYRAAAAVITSIRHIHLRLPEPRPICPRHEPSYFDAARMSRLMEHL